MVTGPTTRGCRGVMTYRLYHVCDAAGTVLSRLLFGILIAFTATLASVLLSDTSSLVCAQEVSFTPRYDARSLDGDEDDDDAESPRRPTPHAKQGASHQRHKQYSFAHLSAVFKDMCDGLRRDSRDLRVYEVSAAGLKEDIECSSCRALYRQLQHACKPKVIAARPAKKLPTPTPSPTQPAEPVEEAAEVGESQANQSEEQASESSEVATSNEESVPEQGGDQQEGSELQTATPLPTPTVTPTATPHPSRYPNLEVLDAASRISAAMYESDPEFGEVLKAVQSFSQRLLGAPNLSQAERDYFGILMSYAISAWEGRPGSPLDPKVRAKEDVSDLFQ